MAIHIVSKNYVFASLLAHRNSGCLIAKRSFGLSGPTTIKAVVDSHRHSGRPTKGTHMKAYKPPKTRRHGRHVPVLRTRQSSSELRGPQQNKYGQTHHRLPFEAEGPISPPINPSLETKRIADELSANCLLDRRCGGETQTGRQCTIEPLYDNPPEGLAPEEWDQPSVLDRDQPSKLVGRNWAETIFPKQDE